MPQPVQIYGQPLSLRELMEIFAADEGLSVETRDKARAHAGILRLSEIKKEIGVVECH